MEVAVPGLPSPSLIVLKVSVDVKQNRNESKSQSQELCESRGGHPGFPVPNSPYGFCGHKVTVKRIHIKESRAV